jgi:hypothetical protein
VQPLIDVPAGGPHARRRAEDDHCVALPETVVVRLECCERDLPSRLLSADTSTLTCSAPLHLCGAPALGTRLALRWTDADSTFLAQGRLLSILERPSRWTIEVVGDPIAATREQRHPAASVAVLWAGTTMIAATLKNSSRQGACCLVGGRVAIGVGEQVRLVVAGHDRRGRVVRVRRVGNSLEVGVHFDGTSAR